MNPALITLFRDEHYIELLRHNLPLAFEVVEAECKRVQWRKGRQPVEMPGPEVGLAREKILISYLRHTLGDMHVELPSATSSMQDVLIFGHPLEIKTATANGTVKAKWTGDATAAKQDVANFQFTADLLLVRIWWGMDTESIFYVPVEVLKELSSEHQTTSFLTGAGGAAKGIDIKRWFMEAAQRHDRTVRIPIDWQRTNLRIDPMARWMAFWADRRDRDPLYG